MGPIMSKFAPNELMRSRLYLIFPLLLLGVNFHTNFHLTFYCGLNGRGHQAMFWPRVQACLCFNIFFVFYYNPLGFISVNMSGFVFR